MIHSLRKFISSSQTPTLSILSCAHPEIKVLIFINKNSTIIFHFYKKNSIVLKYFTCAIFSIAFRLYDVLNFKCHTIFLNDLNLNYFGQVRALNCKFQSNTRTIFCCCIHSPSNAPISYEEFITNECANLSVTLTLILGKFFISRS